MINQFIHFSIGMMLTFVMSHQLNGQCVADAGDDLAICTFWNLDTFYLGGSPAGSGGTPPYTYLWTCAYSNEWVTYTAENFLDNVSIANPRIAQSSPFDDPLTFYLTVTDSAGVQCIDSVRVQFSHFIITLDGKFAHIHQGDSAQLYTSVHGGIPPISYQWSPVTGLTDPTDVYTFASPQSTTTYDLLVTDSAGCQVMDQFFVFVVPTSAHEARESIVHIDLYPNPLIDVSTFNVTGILSSDQLEILVYDFLGRLKKKLIIGQGNLNLYKSDFEPGIYTCHLMDKNITLSVRKFLVY